MKNFLLLFLFSFFVLVSFGQSWSPIHGSSKYNYKLDTADYITHTVWVDSSEVIDNDSVFYLNRIVRTNKSCDSIIQFGWDQNAYCNLCRAWKNQPQFLQRTVHQNANGIFHFTDTLNFVIDVSAQVNETWTFDTTNSITAEVVSAELENIFGISDSVKTIILSSGDSIKLSKEYGITLFPDFSNQGTYYRLAGIENPDIGEKVPGFWEMYDYAVGGVLCMDGHGQDVDGPGYQITKRILTSKEVFPDKIKYGCFKIDTVNGGVGVGFFSSYTTTVTFVNSPNADYNAYNKQLITLGDGYYFCQLSKTNNKYVKSMGIPEIEWSDVHFKLSDSVPDLLIPAYSDIFNGSFDALEYMEGLGLYYYVGYCQSQCTNYYNYSYLEDGSTDPNFCLPFTISIEEVQTIHVNIFPNPATTELTISGYNPSHLKLCNTLGQTIAEASNSNKLWLGNLQQGLYLLQVFDKKGELVKTEKIVKK